MTTRFFVDPDGNYLGGFDGADPPPLAIEVPGPPDDGRQKWSGTEWLPYQRPYDDARRAAYPALGDQLDAILKGFNTMRLGGQNLPDDLDSIINQWLAVKAEHPKPEDA